MYLTMLVKWAVSGGTGCPSVYATDDPDMLVVQGLVLDEATRGNLQQVLAGEDAVLIPKETVLRAARMLEEAP